MPKLITQDFDSTRVQIGPGWLRERAYKLSDAICMRCGSSEIYRWRQYYVPLNASPEHALSYNQCEDCGKVSA